MKKGKERDKILKSKEKEKKLPWEGRDKRESYKVLQTILQYCGVACWRIKGRRYNFGESYEDEILTAILPLNSSPILNIYPELRNFKCSIAFIYRQETYEKWKIQWDKKN